MTGRCCPGLASLTTSPGRRHSRTRQLSNFVHPYQIPARRQLQSQQGTVWANQARCCCYLRSDVFILQVSVRTVRLIRRFLLVFSFSAITFSPWPRLSTFHLWRPGGITTFRDLPTASGESGQSPSLTCGDIDYFYDMRSSCNCLRLCGGPTWSTDEWN